jgi:hypothetical protein
MKIAKQYACLVIHKHRVQFESWKFTFFGFKKIFYSLDVVKHFFFLFLIDSATLFKPQKKM